ncbi:MAG: 4-alpha-glucanotransferase [Phycisphaeraceae bacterium]|nr:MAG: 4-alpha-glucanotransferase [Phycisphaeraceae bacterium]
MSSSPMQELNRLARLCGVLTSYHDADGNLQSASPEALLATLRALGESLERIEDAGDALHKHIEADWSRTAPPVVVAWDGDAANIDLRLAERESDGQVRFELTMESGQVERWVCDLSHFPVTEVFPHGSTPRVTKRVVLPGGHEPGRHQLRIELGSGEAKSTLLAAPMRMYGPEDDGEEMTWGLFAPLYALRTTRDWGVGDLSDFESLARWGAGLGARLFSTLPMLATFLDEPFDPSPYAPVSRLFWNELYLDLTRAPELAGSPAARALLDASETRAEIERLRSSTMVEYRAVMQLKRRVLDELASTFFSTDSERRRALEQRLRDHPDWEAYARFRATVERRGEPWRRWPERLRDGDLRPGDYEESARRRHLYAQWLLREQLKHLDTCIRDVGAETYLDLSVGTHPDGFDVWRERSSFSMDASVGAPPDALFSGGQDWGLQPLHPEHSRESGHRHFTDSIRNHMAHAGRLRIDHVMGLHRLYWIPRGMKATEGVYVQYPAEELYAALSIESHRHKCSVVGENLGTVPEYVPEAMSKHRLSRLYVAFYESEPYGDTVLKPSSARSVASLNTHDMPTFAGFWRGLDIDDRLELGLIDQEERSSEHASREHLRHRLTVFLEREGLLRTGDRDERAIMSALLTYLGRGRAEATLVSLEDLWLEDQPQNVPGTHTERPNWRRRFARTLEEAGADGELVETLRRLDSARRETFAGRSRAT